MILYGAWVGAVVLGLALAAWLSLPRAPGATPTHPAWGHCVGRALRSALVGIVLPWSAGAAVLACFAAWMLLHGQFLGFAKVWLGFVQAWSLASVVFLLHRMSTRRRPLDAAPLRDGG